MFSFEFDFTAYCHYFNVMLNYNVVLYDYFVVIHDYCDRMMNWHERSVVLNNGL